MWNVSQGQVALLQAEVERLSRENERLGGQVERSTALVEPQALALHPLEEVSHNHFRQLAAVQTTMPLPGPPN